MKLGKFNRRHIPILDGLFEPCFWVGCNTAATALIFFD